ncbi:MAG TPA: ABC transporter permease [Dehalococcoidia bacterium]|nr:ABC transporter permease [Dehalococcoidia bacterium]
MQGYIVRRLLLMVPTLLGVTLFVFLLTRFTPADVVDRLTGEVGYQDEALKAQIREELGLNQGVLTQYFKWLGGVLHLDLGESFISGRDIWDELKNRVPVSVELGALAMLFSILFGIPIGVISAIRQDTWLDYLLRGGSILLLAVPVFFLAISVLAVGAWWFDWAPPSRYTAPWEDLQNNLAIMATPAIILGLALSGAKIRLTRTQMLEVLRQDYIRTAWAKGLSERVVILRHALRNALIPVVTVIGLQIPVLVAGAVILENIFLLPGVGRYLVQSAASFDYPVVQGITLLIATVVVLSNLVVDLSYAALDPRVRY